LREWMEHGI